MYSRVVLISVVHFIVIVFISSRQCECQGNGITVSLGNRVIPNHGVVTTDDIGEDPTGMNLMVGLKCSTTYEQCCTGTGSMTSTASWHHAHTAIPVQDSGHQDPFAFGMRRSGQAVYLFRNKAVNPATNGIWRCTIPDSNGVVQTKYIGIYSMTGGSSGRTGILSVGSPGTIQFTMVSEDPVVFNLTFRTTGGPATYVTWTRDGVNISSLADNRYTPSQTVVPNVVSGKMIYTAGDYDNILTVSGRLSGVYGVSVTNDRTTTPVTASTISVIDSSSASISLSGERSQDLRSIILSWTLDNPQTFSVRYDLKYTECNFWSDVCGNTVSVTGITATSHNLADVDVWRIYNFTVLANFQLESSSSTVTYVLPLASNFHTVTTTGILRPEIVSVSELADITSVQVTWNQPEGGLAADEYVVSYRRLNGRDGQCSSFQDEDSVTVNGAASTANLNLQAYSVYAVNVTGRNGGLLNTSTITEVETNSTVPSEAPQNLAIMDSTSTSVTISWESVECIHRNGPITHYNIQYGPVGDTTNRVTEVRVNSNTPDNGGMYMARGLNATKNYMFKVAAVNSNGSSEFATISTNKSFQAPELRDVLALNETSVQVTWNQPEGGLAADEYVVSYRRLNGRDGLCSSFQDEDSVTVNGGTNTINLHLQAYSVYAVNVTGRNGDIRHTSTITVFETNSTVPSGAPQNLAIMDSNSTSVTISWNSVECIHRNGLITHYIISYGPVGETNQQLIVNVTVANSESDDGSRYMYTATGLQPDVSYTFKVAAVNDAGVGMFASVSENIGVLPPQITSVSELANITSVQVTWNQPEGGLAADEYAVSYRRLNGRDGQCSSFQDEDSVTVRAEESVTNTLNLHLQAYSVYAVNVASRLNNALDSASSTVQVETNSTIPSGAPQNLAINNSTSTNVTISWDSVECIHRNGLIIHYLLVYLSKDDLLEDSHARMIDTSYSGQENHPQDSYTYTATGLDHLSFSYLFKVAAVNNIGIGPFATVETREGATSTTTVTAAATVAMATVIVILLIIVAVLCGIILAIWVFKNRTQGHSNHLAKNKQLPGMAEDDDITETQSKPHEAVYDEINLSSDPPKTSMEMETCPAYDVTKTRQD